MRLASFTIGSDKPGEKQQFKNLKNVVIDFDEREWITLVIGWNGTGKSNVLEALATLFRELIGAPDNKGGHGDPVKPSFSYIVRYYCHGKEIEINADPDRISDFYKVSYRSINSEKSLVSPQGGLLDEGGDSQKTLTGIRYADFKKRKDEFLPRYVFGYYSGHSDRMQSVFRPYLQRYDKKLRSAKSEDPGLRRLFYSLPVHSQFVLLAFVLQQDELVQRFLDAQLGLDTNKESESVDSILFVLNEPSWNLNKSKKPKGEYGACQDNPDIFWGAEGVVRDFLDRVHKVCTAPIRNTRKDDSTFWNKKSREYVYLFIKDLSQLEKLVGEQRPREFFRDLESTYVSELLKEVRIRVKLKKNDGSVTFRELSEGEQQLLTVLGLLRFTAEDESLFLLDEPDTHLNPRWSVDYLHYLKSFVGQSSQGQSNSHIVLTTHNPLAIAELVKEQVQVLYREPGSNVVIAENPAVDPKGMGFAGIVTSDMFGLGTSLDKATNEDLLALHQLSTQQTELSEADRARLVEIRTRLEKLDFNFGSRDRLEQEYLRARFDLAVNGEIEGAIITPENKQKALDALVKSLLRSLQEGQS